MKFHGIFCKWNRKAMFQKSFGITNRLILICLGIGIIPLVITGLLGMSVSQNISEGVVSGNLQSSSELQVQKVKENLYQIVKNGIFLSGLPSLQGYLEGDLSKLSLVESEFLEFNRAHPEYYQIRFIDLTGMEIFRSNHKNNRFYLTPEKDLQDKSGRYYFEEGAKLGVGEVYFSPIDLNIEKSKIEKPHLKVIRMITSVRLGEVKKGFIVINLYADQLFQWIKLPKTRFITLLLDSRGELLHVEHNENSVLENVGQGKNISEIFPSIDFETIQSGPSDIISLDSQIMVFRPIKEAGNFTIPMWYLMTLFPKSYLDTQTSQWKWIILISGGLVAFMWILLGLYVARQITRPIRQLTKGAELIAGGDLDHESPPIESGEIKELFDKFNEMRLQIKNKQSELSRQKIELSNKLDWHVEEITNLERQLHRADKLASLGELSMRIAHEIGNPLASIKIVTQTMLEESDGDPDQREYFNKILSEVDRLDLFLKKFSNFAVMKESEPVPCDLSELIREVNFFLKKEAEEKGLLIQEEFKPGLEKILVDPQQVKQITINLVLNAIQASDNPGNITISLRNINQSCVCEVRDRCFCKEQGLHPGASEFVEMSVRDFGQGIPESDLIKIFDPFYSTKSDGTGLGLSVVHRIVEKHNGMVRVYSKVGEGTRFNVYFPKLKGLGSL